MKTHIIIDPKIMVGKPVIAGTRITVEQILRMLGQEIPVDEILDDFPQLKKEDIYAAITYASSLVAHEEIYPKFIKAKA